MLRFSTNLILLASILFLPWWVAIAAAVLFVFMISSFYEVIIWGLFADMLYGTHIAHFYNISLFLSMGALLLFVMLEFFKKSIRLYN